MGKHESTNAMQFERLSKQSIEFSEELFSRVKEVVHPQT
jgi:hypothetical protein